MQLRSKTRKLAEEDDDYGLYEPARPVVYDGLSDSSDEETPLEESYPSIEVPKEVPDELPKESEETHLEAPLSSPSEEVPPQDAFSKKSKVTSKRVLPTSKKSLVNTKSIPLPEQKTITQFAKLPPPSFSDDDAISVCTEKQKPPYQSTVFTPLPPIQTTRTSSPPEVQWLKDPPPSAPNTVPRSARVSISKTPPPFANDPLREPSLPLPSQTDVDKLNGEHHLSTALLDYLLHKGLPKTLSDNILIGSSNSLSWFQKQNQKSDQDHKSFDPDGAKLLRRKYQFYSLQPYQFFVTNCGQGHFTVAWVSFDPNKDHFFEKVYIYDSYRRSKRKSQAEKPKPNETPGLLLQELQKFLFHYCLFGTRNKNVLVKDPKLILRSAVYVDCPQQTNHYDCALFALGTLLHLLNGYLTLDLSEAFTPSDVTNLRKGLYKHLTLNAEISYAFLSSFFRRLASTPSMVEERPSDSPVPDEEKPEHENELDLPTDNMYSDKKVVYDVETPS